MKNLRVMFDVRDVVTDVNSVVADTTDNLTGAGAAAAPLPLSLLVYLCCDCHSGGNTNGLAARPPASFLTTYLLLPVCPPCPLQRWGGAPGPPPAKR